MKPRRPALRYHGGKWRLAPWILSHFPPHRYYVEPYGGGASVLLRKARLSHEVYNDLDGEVVNFFQVLRDHGEELRRLVYLTPFARSEYALSKEPNPNPIEQARRTLVRSFQGHGSSSLGRVTGFRSKSLRNSTGAAAAWMNLPAAMEAMVDRLRGVVIEHRPALEVIAQHDHPDALFYLDPPYVHSTRSTVTEHGHANSYGHEMTDQDHRDLATAIHSIQGIAALSALPLAPLRRALPLLGPLRDRSADRQPDRPPMHRSPLPQPPTRAEPLHARRMSPERYLATTTPARPAAREAGGLSKSAHRVGTRCSLGAHLPASSFGDRSGAVHYVDQPKRHALRKP